MKSEPQRRASCEGYAHVLSSWHHSRMDNEELRKLLAAALAPLFWALILFIRSLRKKPTSSDGGSPEQTRHKAYLFGRKVRALWNGGVKR